MSPFATTSRTRVIAVAVLAALSACKPSADGGVVDRKAQIAADQARRGITQRRAAAMARMFAPKAVSDREARVFKSDQPYKPRVGYLVRGTDLLLFLPCGERQDYFLVSTPAVIARVKQYYRFMTQRPYIPVYLELNSRFIEDTITVANVTYKHIVDAKDFTGDSLGAPRCPRPMPGEVMDRVRKYEPDL